MSKFYTFVDELENAIFQRYYNENGDEVVEKVDSYNYKIYVEHPKGDSDQITLKNGKLKELKFDKINDLRTFYKENKDLMKLHGNDSAVHQFIANEYQGDVLQTCNVKILNYDIEVSHGENTKAFSDDYIISLSDGNNVIYKTIKEVREHYDDYKQLKVFDICQNDWLDFHDTGYYVQELGFSNPIDADQEIITISAKLFGDHPFHTFGTKPLEEYDNPNGVYIQCKDEKDLLAKFIKYWRDSNPQFITGWNIENFDNVYLINRIINVLGEKVPSMLSPFYGKVRNNSRLIKQKKMDNGQVKYEIFGITTFDYIELYKKYNPEKQESYKLDHIGEVEVEQRKVNYDEYGRNLMKMYNGTITVDMDSDWNDLDEIMRYARAKELIKAQLKEFGYEKEYGSVISKIDINKVNFKNLHKLSNDQLKGIFNYCDERVKTLSYKKFISYNEQDANIVELIDNVKSFIKLGIRVGHMSKSRMREIFGTVSPWDNMIYSRLLVDNRQIPPRELFEKSEKFAGAYVKDPIIGKHKWLVSFDYASLDCMGR